MISPESSGVSFAESSALVQQARKSSEDAQAAEYAQFEKVWAG